MQTHPPVDWSEKRAAPRKQFSARGFLALPDGSKVSIKTLDASTMGVGIEHDVALPRGARTHLALGVLGRNGVPTVFQATAEVRHSILALGGRWRTGLLFLEVSAAHQALLEDLLKPKLSFVDTVGHH